MTRLSRYLLTALVGGMSASAFGYGTVTENFTNNTDSYWSHSGNLAGGQSYAWSNSNNVGAPSTAGELGGTFFQAGQQVNGNGTNASYYAFNTGALDVTSNTLDASGKFHLNSANSRSGMAIGFFNAFPGVWPDGTANTNKPDNFQDFIGFKFGTGTSASVHGSVFDFLGAGDSPNEDRTDFGPTVAAGQTVSWSFHYDPPPAGSSNKGAASYTVDFGSGPVTQGFSMSGDAFSGTDAMNFFGVMPLERASGGSTCIDYVDDLTFSSINQLPPTPEPTSLGLLALGGLGMVRRRRA